MATHDELERIAHAANAYRPDWPVRSVLTYLENDQAHRSYRDLAVALAYVATDPTTKTPRRLSEAGPWWTTTRESPTAVLGPRHPRCQVEGHSHCLAANCGACKADAAAAEDDRATALAAHGLPRETVRQILTNAGVTLDARMRAAGDREDES